MSTVLDNLTGHQFGKLLVMELAGRRADGIYWHCVCECGQSHTARANNLRGGRTANCPACGYRRNGPQHQVAREKVPAKRRKVIARKGAKARRAGATP